MTWRHVVLVTVVLLALGGTLAGITAMHREVVVIVDRPVVLLTLDGPNRVCDGDLRRQKQ